MGRRKKLKSDALATGRARLAGMAAIDPALDLDNGLSVQAFQEATDRLAAAIAAYNGLLSELDGQLNAIQQQEKALVELSSRLLRRVAADFGLDSNEYERVGGTRASERKKPGPKPKVTV